MPDYLTTVRSSVLAATALLASLATPAFAQTSDADMLAPLADPDADLLAPLVDPDADLLAPLVDPDADLLAPLVDPDADLLAPLVPKKPVKTRRPGKVTHKDEIELGPEENGFMLVKRKIIDPCGDFEISWGGRKTCHQTEREKWEYVAVGKKPPKDKEEPPEEEEKDDRTGRSPGGLPPGSGPKGGANGPGSGPSGGPGTGPGNGPGQGPRGPGPGGPPGSNPGGGKAPGKGDVVAPSPDRLAPLRDFAVRPIALKMDAQGRFDVTLTVRNIAKSGKLIANGDWTVTLTDADGLGFGSRDIWMPGAGPAKPFRLMPTVAPGGVQQIRFLVPPEAIRSSVVRLSVQQGNAPPATFDVSTAAVGRAPARQAPPISSAPFATLHKFDVRIDRTQQVGNKLEIFFTARNRTRELQYLGGSNLTFRGTGPDGQPAQSRRETFSIRGTRGAPTGMAPIQPGASARLRQLFDAAHVKGPWSVTDGIKTATLQPPASAAPTEPDW